jgi:PIN domain nuclease of toxin-antitoxin system
MRLLQQLPHHHKDPFDRLLIAQAIVEDLPVLSLDPLFVQYPILVFAA